MNRPLLAACAGLFLLLVGASDTGPPEKTHLLHPLLKMRNTIDRGVTAYLGGETFANSFPDWTVEYESTADKIRDQIVQLGGTTARTRWIEADLRYVQEGTTNKRLDLFLLTAGSKVKILRLTSSTITSSAGSRLDPMDGAARPMGKAMLALSAAMARESEPPDLIVSEEDLDRDIRDENARELLKRNLATTRETWKKAWNTLHQVKTDDARLYLDDVIIVVMDKKGRELGTIKADFDTNGDNLFDWAFEKLTSR